jgi:hypothetical protein
LPGKPISRVAHPSNIMQQPSSLPCGMLVRASMCGLGWRRL